jgi:hypothetical protein
MIVTTKTSKQRASSIHLWTTIVKVVMHQIARAILVLVFTVVSEITTPLIHFVEFRENSHLNELGLLPKQFIDAKEGRGLIVRKANTIWS